MYATIDGRLTISKDEGKTIPLAVLAEFLTEQNIESVVLESIVESLDVARVEALCGEKRAHGNGEHRFQRAGTDTRTAVTTAGEHKLDLHYVEDTAAEQDEASYFSKRVRTTTVKNQQKIPVPMINVRPDRVT